MGLEIFFKKKMILTQKQSLLIAPFFACFLVFSSPGVMWHLRDFYALELQALMHKLHFCFYSVFPVTPLEKKRTTKQ